MSIRATDVKTILEERLSEIGREVRAAHGEFVVESQRRLDELKAGLEALRDRQEETEARAMSPGRVGGSQASREEREHMELFTKWLRRPGDPEAQARLSEFQNRLQAKDVTIATGAPGGFAVPQEIAREIELLEKKFSPVRNLVKVVQVSTGDFKHLVDIRGATAGWVGESGSRTATATQQLREIAPTFGELYAYPQTSEWALDDIFFNVAGWLTEAVAQEFAILEGDAVIRGNGTDKPTGMLNTAPVATEDFASPLRAAAAYQFITSDSGASPADGTVTADSLITLAFSLNSIYRVGATFVMNSKTMGGVRRLKDLNGAYLWQPGLGGQPDRLLGFPLAAWEQMDDEGINKFPVAFGDFRRGYVLADRVGLRITRDNVTNPGFVRFYIRRREGGHVLNNDAIKFLKTV